MQQSIDELLRELEDLAVKRVEANKALQEINDRAEEIRNFISQGSIALNTKIFPQNGPFDAAKRLVALKTLTDTIKKNGYDKNFGLLQKVDFILNIDKKYKTVRAIVEVVKDFEGLTDESDTKLIAEFSWIISDQIRKGQRYDRFKNEGKGQFLIGFKEWFNKDGSYKKEYLSFSSLLNF